MGDNIQVKKEKNENAAKVKKLERKIQNQEKAIKYLNEVVNVYEERMRNKEKEQTLTMMSDEEIIKYRRKMTAQANCASEELRSREVKRQVKALRNCVCSRSMRSRALIPCGHLVCHDCVTGSCGVC